MTSRLPTPPGHLSAASKRLWKAILEDWPISDRAHLALLQTALESRDRAERCRRQIDKAGETVQDRFGQTKPHPLLTAERDSRSAFITAVKALGLDPEKVEDE
jgi:P27 family predicted phage terminase small subunit